MITEKVMEPGSWSVKFKPDTPREIMDTLAHLGHVVITEARVDPVSFGSTNLLSAARYVGVLIKRGLRDASGFGMEWWLGDNDGKGLIFETQRDYDSKDVEDFLTMGSAPYGILLDDAGGTTAIEAGSISSDATTKSARFQFVNQREALQYVAELFDMEYRVNHDGTLDFDTKANLFVTTTPEALFLVVDEGVESGEELDIEGFHIKDPKYDVDAKEQTSRVVLIDKTGAATGVDAGSFPYKDIHGNDAVRVKLVSKDVLNENATAHATRELERTERADKRDMVEINLDRFLVRGSWRVGDTVYIYNPVEGLFNLSNEVYYRGRHAYPAKRRVFQHTWSIAEGMGVYYRAKNGTVTDLTDYVEFETGGEKVTVGARKRSLTKDSKFVTRPELIAVKRDANAFAYQNDAGNVIFLDDEKDERFRINTGGDMVFYADNGSTVTLRWDESDSRWEFNQDLDLGTNSIHRSAPKSGRWGKNATDNITASTWVAMRLDTTIHESGGAGDWDDIGGSNPERITVPEAGLYLVVANVYINSNTTGSRQVRISKNGVSTSYYIRTDATAFQRFNLSGIVECSANDYITVEAWQSSGSTLYFQSNNQNSISVTKLI